MRLKAGGEHGFSCWWSKHKGIGEKQPGLSRVGAKSDALGRIERAAGSWLEHHGEGSSQA